MTPHQAHIPDSTIKIISRWRLDAFLIYLQGKVATFTKGVASETAKMPNFTIKLTPPTPLVEPI